MAFVHGCPRPTLALVYKVSPFLRSIGTHTHACSISARGALALAGDFSRLVPYSNSTPRPLSRMRETHGT